MTPEEVMAVLEIEDTSITHSELENEGVKFLTVSGQQYCGEQTVQCTGLVPCLVPYGNLTDPSDRPLWSPRGVVQFGQQV